MLERKLLRHLEGLLTTEILRQTTLSGGDINTVLKLETPNKPLVIKLNSAEKLPTLFKVEAKGLEKLSQSNSFIVPKALKYGQFEGTSFLILEYISTSALQVGFWSSFAQSLAQLHKNTATTFGLDHDNYIGSLPQYNQRCETASEFYITQRLEPQFRLASKQGYTFKNLSSFYNQVEKMIPNEEASLIHGDLWNGNYLVSKTNTPVLIDPAIAYGSREMDIAMMMLFGGFPTKVIDAYNVHFPLRDGWQNRVQLFQLYYILVHVNIFGGGYYEQALHIIKSYR